jgi:hypothetical protein
LILTIFSFRVDTDNLQLPSQYWQFTVSEMILTIYSFRVNTDNLQFQSWYWQFSFRVNTDNFQFRNTNKGGYTFLKKLFTIVKAKIYTPWLERSFISNIYIFSFYLSEGYYQYRFWNWKLSVSTLKLKIVSIDDLSFDMYKFDNNIHNFLSCHSQLLLK